MKGYKEQAGGQERKTRRKENGFGGARSERKIVILSDLFLKMYIVNIYKGGRDHISPLFNDALFLLEFISSFSPQCSFNKK